jgi:hypothetical protein
MSYIFFFFTYTKSKNRAGGLIEVGGGGGKEMVKEGDYGANTIYTYIKWKNDIC